MIPFVKFSKIPRLNRDMIITEKIDGTNAQIFIEHKAIIDDWVNGPETADWVYEFGNRVLVENELDYDYNYYVFAGSRNRWISQADDNYGFAKWVATNKDDLARLGPGLHFGEWWGQHIQRGYSLNEKRFSLFNVKKWENPRNRPDCCHCVPVLYEGPFSIGDVNKLMWGLKERGSKAAPGFMHPEGLIVFHMAAGQYFKATCKNDAVPKALVGISF